MKKRKLRKILLETAALFSVSTVSLCMPDKAEAADFSQSSYNNCFTYHDFGTPSINYTLTCIDNVQVSGSQGSWAIRTPNSVSGLDNRWINTIAVQTGGTGGYDNIKSVSINPHLHNKGWVGDNIGSVTGTNYHPYGWTEAIQLKTADELNNYTYMNYYTVSRPVTWPYLVQSTGGTEESLLANNPTADDGWQEGLGVWHVNNIYQVFFGSSPGSYGTYSDWTHFNMGIGGNWAGTAGYSLPMAGLAATVQEYPCNVYINPNGGNWAGATSTVQIGNVGGESTVHAGDNLTFKVLPTRAGYDFAGWSLSYTATSASAATFYQQPGTVMEPKITAGDGSAVYKGIDYSAVYNYEYYRNHHADLRAAFGNDASKYLEHFVNRGMAEGRRASADFDIAYYKNNYADLRNAFGNNNTAYYMHFIFNGAFEGRSGNGTPRTSCTSYGLYVGNVASVTLKANWTPKFDIAYSGVCQTEGRDFFDNNNGKDYSQLTDFVKVPKADSMKINTTKSFNDPDTGAAIPEEITATGVGWAFKQGVSAKNTGSYIKDNQTYSAYSMYNQAKNNNAITYGKPGTAYKGTVPALTSGDIAILNMCRVWDYGPVIKATDRYFTLKQAHDGVITQEELFRGVTAEDDEDGTLVKKKDEEVEATGDDTGLTMLDYLAEEWTTFPCAGSSTITFVAKDSAGNETRYMITVHLTDTEAIDGSGDDDGRVVRGISRKYYDTYKNPDYGWDTYHDYGGLYPDSVYYFLDSRINMTRLVPQLRVLHKSQPA